MVLAEKLVRRDHPSRDSPCCGARQVGWAEELGEGTFTMQPLQLGPRLPEGPRLAGSGTLKKDLKDAQEKRDAGGDGGERAQGRHGGDKAGGGRPPPWAHSWRHGQP